ncbi:MBL fold metallo-hydrolase, partial [bacterium]|nr:MBL fold metallo-hydrolase [bacterium]
AHFHPKSKNYLGYVLTIDGVRVYHAGDTERIPEMQQFDCDIALLPLGQKYTMNSVYEAANSALDVKAKIAIPIHYDMFEGKLSDADAFQEILKGKVKVIIKSSVSD